MIKEIDVVVRLTDPSELIYRCVIDLPYWSEWLRVKCSAASTSRDRGCQVYHVQQI